MSTDVLGYLLSKTLPVKRAPGNEVHFTCFFCQEPEGKRGRLYVNVDPEAEIPGLFECKLCGAHGALPTIMRHFGDRTPQQEKEDDSFIRRAILVESAKFYHENLAENPDAYRWLRDRGLTIDTIQEKQLGYANGGLFHYLREHEFRISDILATGLISEDRTTKKIGDFFRHHITIPYLMSGNPVMIRGRSLVADDERKYVTPFGQKSRLYNTDAVWHAENVVLTEGEFDCLIVEQLGYPAVGSPGAGTWQDTWDGYFTDVHRLYIVFDNDDAGRRGAQKVTDRLGSRCRTVQMPEPEFGQPKNDLSEWVGHQGHTREDFAELLRGSSGGLLVSVAEAIHEHAELQGMTGLKFGLTVFDILIDPGLLPSQLMIPLAKTGTGKTIWLLNCFQWLANAQPDAKFLFVSLEQTRGDWWERARRIFRFLNVGATDKDVEAFWTDRIMLVDRNRITEEQLLQVIDDFTDEWGKPAAVGIDYLGYYAQSYPGDSRYERVSDAVMGLKAVAKEARVPMIVPHQVSRMTLHGSEPTIDNARDSVTGDTRILLADGSFVPIAELVSTLPTVVTTTRDYRFDSRATVRVWKKGDRNVYKVTTESGRCFKATPEHPMLTADGRWTPIADLTVGARIGLPDHVPVFGVERLAHAELIGHLIADGGLTTSPVTYTEGHDEIRAHVIRLAQEAGVDPLHRKGSKVEVFLSNRVCARNPVTEMIRGLGLFGVKSPLRFIPAVVFRSRQEDVAGVLRGLFASDGDISARGVRFNSSSERLARDVQHLLSRFGIRSCLTRERYGRGGYKDGTFWRVSIRQYASVLTFARKIGSVGCKAEALDALLLRQPTSAHHVDLFPSSLWSEIHAARRANGLGWSSLSHSGDPKRTSVVESRQIRRDRLCWLAEQVGAKRLHDLATSPLIFERIVSIETARTEPVYDMTVVGTRNFVGDFVYSNSGVVEETADFVLLLWSEDTLHNKSMEDRTGQFFMKIGKSRHGGAGHKEDMRFAPLGLAIVPAGDKERSMWAFNEMTYQAQYQESWEQALVRHEAGSPRDEAKYAKVLARFNDKRQGQLPGPPDLRLVQP